MFHGVSWKVVLKKHSARIDGTCLVLLQVIANREPKYFNLGFHVLPQQFDERSGKVVKLGDMKIQKSYNDTIERARARLFDIVHELHFRDKPITIHEIEKVYDNPQLKNKVLPILINLIAGESDRYPDSAKDYQQTLTKLLLYAPHVVFAELDSEWIRNWDAWMARNKLAQNTRSKHHKNFKKFLNVAREASVRMGDPYANFKVERIRGSRTALLGDELDKLVKAFAANQLPLHEMNALRCFLWCSGTGMRYNDLRSLDHSQITGNMLEFMPHKTRRHKQRVIMSLGHNLMMLVNTRVGKVFNVTTSNALNNNLKSIRKKLHIHNDMTIHVARHTFATLFLENGGAPEVCMELMGIRKWETMKIYIHLAESRKREANHRHDALYAGLVGKVA